MQKLLIGLLLILFAGSCGTDDIIDSAKDLLGVEDKFTAEIDGKKWAAEIRVVKKESSPVNSFTISGTSLDGRVIHMTTAGIEEGTYRISLAESILNLSLKMFIGTYTPDVTDLSTLNKATGGKVTISEIGTKDGKHYISGTFELTIETDAGTVEITKGVFNELEYKEEQES